MIGRDALQESPQVFEKEDPMEWIGRRLFETETIVEAGRLGMGVSDDRAYAHGLRNDVATQQRILEKGPTEPSALMLSIHS